MSDITFRSLIGTAGFYPCIMPVSSKTSEKRYVSLHINVSQRITYRHKAGMVITLHNNCRTGCPTYILSEFNLPKLIRAIRQHRITDLLVVPPVLIKLEKSGLDLSRVLSSVKRILSGAAPLTAEQADNLKKCLGRDDVSINQGWGMTEATAGVTVPFRGSFCRSGSSGFLMPNIVAKIIDSDGKGVGYGQEGEIFLRGPNIIMGYWKDEAATAATISKGGWLKTGDIVSVQPDGSINVVGRAKVGRRSEFSKTTCYFCTDPNLC